jgi:hypothetical protein
MSTKKTAKVVIISSTKLPTLTAGDITPEALCSFENACKNYITKRAVTPQTMSLISQAASLTPLISDWYWLSQEKYDAMMLKDFLAEVHAKWLAKD